MTRMAVARASAGEVSYDPNGRSTTTSARLAAEATARPKGIISSTVMGSVVLYPSALSAAESPTSRTSMPASSKIDAVIES